MDVTHAALFSMATNLSELALKGTATIVFSKIQSLKEEKKIEVLRSTYDDLISQLVEEREEAIRIAQAYKSEFERVAISDKDIEHLHNTVSVALEILKEMTPNSNSIESFEKFKELISVDTLKAMQLLGFNYKAAIGQPLTDLCGNAIRGFGANEKNPAQKTRGR